MFFHGSDFERGVGEVKIIKLDHSIMFLQNKKSNKGFSLVELLVAMTIFVLIALMIMETFFSVMENRRKVRAVEQDVEDARYAMELMAKTVRMSSVFYSSVGSIEFYDYSQAGCYRYRMNNGRIIKDGPGIAEQTTTADEKLKVTNCSFNGSENSARITGDGVVHSLSFDVIESDANTMGQATMAMQICAEDNCEQDSVIIQDTVSLRDYTNI